MQWEPWGEDDEIDCREFEYFTMARTTWARWTSKLDERPMVCASVGEQRNNAVPRHEETQLLRLTTRGAGGPFRTKATRTSGQNRCGRRPQAPCTASHSTTRDGRFGWVVAGIAKGRGVKRRRALARCIVDAWPSWDDGGGVARVSCKELYRRGVAIGMRTREIRTELGAVAIAGLVRMEDDDVFCGEESTVITDSGGCVAGSSRAFDGSHGTAITTPTTAAPAAKATRCINNTGGTTGVDNTGGSKRGREPLENVLGADRVTRSRSMASGRSDNNDGLAQGSADPAEVEGGPIVRSAISSDWAAYFILYVRARMSDSRHGAIITTLTRITKWNE